jgi:hypothetical protein
LFIPALLEFSVIYLLMSIAQEEAEGNGSRKGPAHDTILIEAPLEIRKS